MNVCKVGASSTDIEADRKQRVLRCRTIIELLVICGALLLTIHDSRGCSNRLLTHRYLRCALIRLITLGLSAQSRLLKLIALGLLIRTKYWWSLNTLCLAARTKDRRLAKGGKGGLRLLLDARIGIAQHLLVEHCSILNGVGLLLGGGIRRV